MGKVTKQEIIEFYLEDMYCKKENLIEIHPTQISDIEKCVIKYFLDNNFNYTSTDLEKIDNIHFYFNYKKFNKKEFEDWQLGTDQLELNYKNGDFIRANILLGTTLIGNLCFAYYNHTFIADELKKQKNKDYVSPYKRLTLNKKETEEKLAELFKKINED